MISHISQPAEAPEKLRSLRPSSAVSSPATNRKRAADGDDGMFSPTSAAAIALSSLHNFGAAREKSLASDLTGVQLFNNNINISNGVTNAHAKYRGTSPVPYGAAPGSFETRNTFAPDTSVAAWGAPPPPGHPGRAAFMAAAQYQSYTQAQQPEIANVTTRLSPTTAQELQYAEKQQRNQYLNHHRASPVSMIGHTPTPTSMSNAYHNPVQLTNEAASKFTHLTSCALSLVTPTPKKVKVDHKSGGKGPNYSRKKKSLGVLAENFLNAYRVLPKGSTIVVDEAAVELGVERRRIYDVVNILESICLVCKKHKNTYTWMGMDHLDAVFGRLQSQAIAEYPEDAEKYLGSRDRKAFLPVPLKPPRKQSKTRENKSLAKLSQEFLQVFLVGHETLSLPEASDKIQGQTSMEELIAMGSNTASSTNARQSAIAKGLAIANDKELKAAAARGLKTKIRRLYDIANVFLSVGLLKKVESGDSSRRPNFSWCYKLTAKELYQLVNCPKSQEGTQNAVATPVPEEILPTVTQDSTSNSDEGETASSAVSSPQKKN